MSRLYASPLRVYLCLGALALVGIYCGLKLPVSLFPNSSKPQITVELSYGSNSPDEFLTSYGRILEEQLRAISTDEVEVEEIRSFYNSDKVQYRIEFKWGAAPQIALKEVAMVANSFAARLPVEVRDSLGIWTNNENSGFFATSFYSPIRSLDELYDLLEPILTPQIAKVKDANEADLWNPAKKEISVELNPKKMASLQLFPRDVDTAVSSALSGQSGGSITVGTQQLSIQMPKWIRGPEDLGRVSIPSATGRTVHLSDVAKVDYGLKSTNSHSFKTSGAPSLILFATPKLGGNVKRMSEDLIQIVQNMMPNLPRDVQYKVLVDPSGFIRSSVNNVFKEVAVGAMLAVVILFLFIGSFKNTVTAAIEIPMSMVLAFILMKISGMNLNLVSLGGLALSAGMNVDASVVVMENIFRHFEEVKQRLDFQGKLLLISRAVAEVRFAVIASTVSSLVVFLPLAFTSDLSYAILGDLAKTVVFSHGFSMFVALILVPTVRLQLMTRGPAGSIEKPVHSPIEPWIRKMENFYAASLRAFIRGKRLQWFSYLGLAVLLLGLAILVLPRLPMEIIGRPDTDWMFLDVNTKGNIMLRQMESQTDEIEAKLLDKLGSKIQYTFVQVYRPNEGSIMARLKDKRDMHEVWKEMETLFSNTPFLKYDVGPWNPAELPIPDPPKLRIALRGGTLEDRVLAGQDLTNLLEEKRVFDRIWTRPDVGRTEGILLKMYPDQWSALQEAGNTITPADISDLSRIATTGKRIGYLSINNRITDIIMRYPEGSIASAEDLAALPIGLKSKLIPLKALARVSVQDVPPTLYRESQHDMVLIFGKQNEGSQKSGSVALEDARKIVAGWKSPVPEVAAVLEDSEIDLHDALRQLTAAVALSILLIFITLVLQFGSFANALLVLIAVPLGFIGVLISLFVFRSTLSLNSVLGVILLNGIAVANSIILVDFLKRLVDRGMAPDEAAAEAGRKRLRPILITSLTTILGMLPIALGIGEGGKILQPLGIAVSGGLWVSMGLTLFVVPALQVAYLNRASKGKKTREPEWAEKTASLPVGLLARSDKSKPAFQPERN